MHHRREYGLGGWLDGGIGLSERSYRLSWCFVLIAGRSVVWLHTSILQNSARNVYAYDKKTASTELAVSLIPVLFFLCDHEKCHYAKDCFSGDIEHGIECNFCFKVNYLEASASEDPKDWIP